MFYLGTISIPAGESMNNLNTAADFDIPANTGGIRLQSNTTGVYAVLRSDDLSQAETLLVFEGEELEDPLPAGAESIEVLSTDDFPESGSLIIDEGELTEEVVTFTIDDETHFDVSETQEDHAPGATVKEVFLQDKAFARRLTANEIVDFKLANMSAQLSVKNDTMGAATVKVFALWG